MQITSILNTLSALRTKTAFGQLLIELVVVMGLMAILLPAIIIGFVATREGRVQQTQRLEAVSFLKETEEAVRSVREKGWSTFAVNGTYHPVISGSSWSLASEAATVNGFTQSVVISDVYRDVNGVIVTTGGTLDLSTKKIVTTISWTLPLPSSTATTMYLTRFMDNAAYTETTQTQFNAGTKTGVTVQATNPPQVVDDGEIILSAGGHGNWCVPSIDTNTLDLPKNGVANALYAIEGSAFATTGENSSGVSFAKVNISSTFPPVPSLANTFDGYKTNGVFGDPNYAYIATDNNTKHVVIIDLNQVVNGKYVEVGYLNAETSTNAKSVYVVANTAYVTVGDDLYTFDVTNKSGEHKKLDSIDLPGTIANSVVVNGNYAYVAIGGDAIEMKIVNVANPSDLSLSGSADVNGQAAKDIVINSTATRAYLATNSSSSQRELFIINIQNKLSPSVVGNGYEASGMDPKAVTLVPGNLVILAGSGGEEYQVVNIANEASPVRCGGVNVDSGINDLASVQEADNDVYSYILVGADPEFRIVDGGPGGGYATSGTFESQTFNPGYQTANNRFSATYSLPANTTLQFQVTMANLTGGVCPSTGGYTFVGPDGTPGTYFTPASGEFVTFPFGAVGNYSNPGQCIRYKAYFTSLDGTSTPVLNDITINYSP